MNVNEPRFKYKGPRLDLLLSPLTTLSHRKAALHGDELRRRRGNGEDLLKMKYSACLSRGPRVCKRVNESHVCVKKRRENGDREREREITIEEQMRD